MEPDRRALEALLIADVPDRFERFRPVETPGVTGPLDLDAAAEAEPDEPAERALLETRGFRRGYARAWRRPDGTVLFALVYEFGTAAGAEAYRRDGQITLEGFGADTFAVPAVDGAAGFSQVEPTDTAGDDGRTVHGVTFTRGTHFFLLFARGRRSAVGAEDARVLAVAQAANL
jgi:hypothetical protein